MYQSVLSIIHKWFKPVQTRFNGHQILSMNCSILGNLIKTETTVIVDKILTRTEKLEILPCILDHIRNKWFFMQEISVL